MDKHEVTGLGVADKGRVHDLETCHRADLRPTVGVRKDHFAEAAALASARVIDALGGATPKRVVVRPPRLVNVVA